MRYSRLHSRSFRMILSIVLIAALLAPLLVLTSEGKYTEEGPESRSLSHGYFIKNQGQINNSDIEYYGRVPDGYITLDSNSVSFWSDSSQKSDLLSFETSDDVVIVGHSEQDYRCHYFLGSRGTYTDVSCYQSLEYRDFTKGVNLAVCYVEDGIDFTFELKEDLSAEEIDTFWDDIKIDKSNLVLGSSGIRFHFDLPIDDSHRYRISQIDDRSLLSICLGGSESDRAQCMTRDQEGNLYIAGSTYSPEFPLRNEFQSYQGGMDAFVTKMNADGSIIYSTCIGGDYTNLLLSEPDDVAEDIAIDAEGNVYLTGNTKSNDFPTENPLYSVSENLTILRGEYQDHQGDVFILKLNSTGNGIEYSTYYGGTNGECGTSIDIDSDGKVFVGGWTSSENIPLINPIDSESYDLFDGFILCLSAAGDEFLFSSFIGGGGIDRVKDLAVCQNGDFVITGHTEGGLSLINPLYSSYSDGTDAFVIKIDSSWDVVYSTYLGSDSRDEGHSVAVDADGVAYVTGYTESADYPILNAIDDTLSGSRDCFVSVISEFGDTLISSTFIGGDSIDYAESISVDSQGQIFIAGTTSSTDFPMAEGTHHGGYDAFVLKMNLSSIICCSCLGGLNDDIVSAMVVDEANNTYICGNTRSEDLPDYLGGYDAFIFGYSLYISQPANTNPEPSMQDVYYTVVSALVIAAVAVVSIIVGQVMKRLRRDQYELTMSLASTSESADVRIEPYKEPIQEIEWNHPTDLPDSGVEPSPEPCWNHPTDLPDGSPEPPPEPLWNHPTDLPDGQPIPVTEPEWNHPTDLPDGDPIPLLSPDWNHPTDLPDGNPIPINEPLWNHPTDLPDKLPIPEPEWNHPTDLPDKGIVLPPKPLWNHPTDLPDGRPIPVHEPYLNYPRRIPSESSSKKLK